MDGMLLVCASMLLLAFPLMLLLLLPPMLVPGLLFLVLSPLLLPPLVDCVDRPSFRVFPANLSSSLLNMPMASGIGLRRVCAWDIELDTTTRVH